MNFEECTRRRFHKIFEQRVLTKIMGKSRILHLFSDFFDFSKCGYNDTLMKIYFRIASCVYKIGYNL